METKTKNLLLTKNNSVFGRCACTTQRCPPREFSTTAHVLYHRAPQHRDHPINSVIKIITGPRCTNASVRVPREYRVCAVRETTGSYHLGSQRVCRSAVQILHVFRFKMYLVVVVVIIIVIIFSSLVFLHT